MPSMHNTYDLTRYYVFVPTFAQAASTSTELFLANGVFVVSVFLTPHPL